MGMMIPLFVSIRRGSQNSIAGKIQNPVFNTDDGEEIIENQS